MQTGSFKFHNISFRSQIYGSEKTVGKKKDNFNELDNDKNDDNDKKAVTLLDFK